MEENQRKESGFRCLAGRTGKGLSVTFYVGVNFMERRFTEDMTGEVDNRS